MPGENKIYLFSCEVCVQTQWRIKFCLFRYFSFLWTVCYYPRAGCYHIILFMVTERNENAGWHQHFIILFLMLINGGSREMGEMGRRCRSHSQGRHVILWHLEVENSTSIGIDHTSLCGYRFCACCE